MADEPQVSTTDDALWFFGVLAILIGVWYFAGGPGRADLKGLFLAPPQPLGSGEAYGPTFGGTETETASTTQTIEEPAPLQTN
jgi:hypothetical protein